MMVSIPVQAYWIDYYKGNYWHGNNYIANHITWTVRNRNIYITLLDEGRDVVITTMLWATASSLDM